MMRKITLPTIALALLTAVRLLAADAAPLPGELTFTTHNSVYNAEGRFDSWKLTKVDIPGGDLTKGTVEIEVDLASVNEKAAKLAAHLRTPDFFDVATHPKATIAITGAKPAGEKRYEATATIDLHGVKGTCPVAFEVVSEKPLAIKGTATLDRTAFKIGQPYDAANKYAPLNEVKIGISAKLTD
ncbi:MAG TPA: YceI family protein [Candidatus Polarisedimenticolaceae bacterium]|nr:YceI family protein [Candidatus Polarisedimenticolaceae bacterium]